MEVAPGEAASAPVIAAAPPPPGSSSPQHGDHAPPPYSATGTSPGGYGAPSSQTSFPAAPALPTTSLSPGMKVRTILELDVWIIPSSGRHLILRGSLSPSLGELELIWKSYRFVPSTTTPEHSRTSCRLRWMMKSPSSRPLDSMLAGCAVAWRRVRRASSQVIQIYVLRVSVGTL